VLPKKYLRAGLFITVVVAVVLLVTWLPGANEANYDTVSLTIVHTNDIHSRIEADAEQGTMGYALMAAAVEEIRGAHENVLLLDAGDTFHGSSMATLSRGQSVVEIMNAIGYTAMAAGNHDFGYGWERLDELSGAASFPVLAANIYQENGERLLQPYIIEELNGIRIGIIGLTTPETEVKTHPDNVKGLCFDDPIETARDLAEEIREKCDLLIALVHLPLDYSADSCARLAEEVEGIDLIVSGHSHVVLEEGYLVNDICIVQAGEHGHYLGLVELEIKNKEIAELKASLYPAERAAELPASAAIQQLIDQIKEESMVLMSEVIGRTEVRLDGERSRVRTGETNLGNLVADAMLAITGADAAITNGGGIRTSLEAGEITRGDILSVLPFGNTVVLLEVKGAVLLAALENGVSQYPQEGGRFPQVAGVSFSFDPAAEPGCRIVEAAVGGRPLEPEKTYTVALNDFLAAGGDGYTMFTEAPVIKEYSLLDSIVADYIRENKIRPVEASGRIVLCEPVLK